VKKTTATPAMVYEFLSQNRPKRYTMLDICKANNWSQSNVIQCLSKMGNIKQEAMKQKGSIGSKGCYYVDERDFVLDPKFKPLKQSIAMTQAMLRVRELYPEDRAHVSCAGARQL
jgi:hypothetical protein